jgi:putative transposase
MGLSPIYQRPRTSDLHPQHRVYQAGDGATQPCLVRRVTYIPMRHGFLYLMAIMDWASRKVLAWRLSNTIGAGFCVAALEEALARFSKPEIFIADQDSPFNSFAFTSVLGHAEVRISMDGRGRWWTTSFSSVSGARSNTSAFISMPSRAFGAEGWPWPFDHRLYNLQC